MARWRCLWLVVAGLASTSFAVAGCRRAPDTPRTEDRVMTDYVQQPLERARGVEAQQVEAARARRQAMEDAANQ